MNKRFRQAGWDGLGIGIFLVMVFPVFWMISTAFKPDDQINSQDPTFVTARPTLSHFTDALHRPFFWDSVKNSLIIVLVAVAISMVLAFLAAIALAKYRFTGRKLFIVLVMDASTGFQVFWVAIRSVALVVSIAPVPAFL